VKHDIVQDPGQFGRTAGDSWSWFDQIYAFVAGPIPPGRGRDGGQVLLGRGACVESRGNMSLGGRSQASSVGRGRVMGVVMGTGEAESTTNDWGPQGHRGDAWSAGGGRTPPSRCLGAARWGDLDRPLAAGGSLIGPPVSSISASSIGVARRPPSSVAGFQLWVEGGVVEWSSPDHPSPSSSGHCRPESGEVFPASCVAWMTQGQRGLWHRLFITHSRWKKWGHRTPPGCMLHCTGATHAHDGAAPSRDGESGRVKFRTEFDSGKRIGRLHTQQSGVGTYWAFGQVGGMDIG